MVACSALARNSQESPSRSTEITIPSGQSAWTFNSARAIAISSASVLAGLLMVALPGDVFGVMRTGCRFAGLLSSGPRRDALPRLLFRDVLGEDPHHIALHGRRGVEHVGGDAFDGIAQGHELRLPGEALGALDAGEFVHGGVADLAVDRLVAILHGELERQTFVVVSYNASPGQRHRTIIHTTGKAVADSRAG